MIPLSHPIVAYRKRMLLVFALYALIYSSIYPADFPSSNSVGGAVLKKAAVIGIGPPRQPKVNHVKLFVRAVAFSLASAMAFATAGFVSCCAETRRGLLKINTASKPTKSDIGELHCLKKNALMLHLQKAASCCTVVQSTVLHIIILLLDFPCRRDYGVLVYFRK